jgi:hypothetical protein
MGSKAPAQPPPPPPLQQPVPLLSMSAAQTLSSLEQAEVPMATDVMEIDSGTISAPMEGGSQAYGAAFGVDEEDPGDVFAPEEVPGSLSFIDTMAGAGHASPLRAGKRPRPLSIGETYASPFKRPRHLDENTRFPLRVLLSSTSSTLGAFLRDRHAVVPITPAHLMEEIRKLFENPKDAGYQCVRVDVRLPTLITALIKLRYYMGQLNMCYNLFETTVAQAYQGEVVSVDVLRGQLQEHVADCVEFLNRFGTGLSTFAHTFSTSAQQIMQQFPSVDHIDEKALRLSVKQVQLWLGYLDDTVKHISDIMNMFYTKPFERSLTDVALRILRHQTPAGFENESTQCPRCQNRIMCSDYEQCCLECQIQALPEPQFNLPTPLPSNATQWLGFVISQLQEKV